MSEPILPEGIDPIRRICFVLYRGLVEIRSSTRDPYINDLADALHNLPECLLRYLYESDDAMERVVRELKRYSTKNGLVLGDELVRDESELFGIFRS